MLKILIVHGAGMNMRGKAQIEVFGPMTLPQYDEQIRKYATELGVEACLSVPGLAGEVERFYQIVVKGQNRKGQPIRIKASGWLARIFQHEIDHLNGILFVDRATKIWKPSEEDAAVPSD